MPNKYLTILTAILFIFLLFSVFIYSSTYNTYTQNRLAKLHNHETPNANSAGDTVTQSVYGEIYNDNLEINTSPQSLIKPIYPDASDKNSSKEVYITIDDGPDPYSTPKYLKILKENEVKATFFMIGSRIERYPELVKQIDSEGHSIGNHSYSHNYYILYKNTENFKDEVLKSSEIIFSIIGRSPKIFRAPGGSPNMHNVEFDNILSELGYSVFDWNVSAADTDPAGITKNQVVYNIEHESKGIKRVIVLMHDNSKRKASIEALPEVIKWFKKKGYQFNVLDENTTPMRIKRKASSPPQNTTVNKSVYQENSLGGN